MDRDYEKIKQAHLGVLSIADLNVNELRTYGYKHTNLKPSDIRSMTRDSLLRAFDNGGGAAVIDIPKGNNGGSNGSGDLAANIARAIEGYIKPAMDESRVQELIADAMAGNVKVVEVRNLDTGSIANVGATHAIFETVLNLAVLRINTFLVGPAGSGKTYLAEQVSKALDLPFYCQSVGLQTSKSDLIGYMDANGNYVASMLYNAYSGGGVFLLDEIDAGNPNVLTVLNAMTSNHQAAFPCGMVSKHGDFILLAAGNTYGRGSDRRYVGRLKLDAATLDRFAVINFDYDATLERALCPDAAWLEYVISIRQAAADLKEDLIVSPRASINGAMMIAAGFTREQAADMLIFKGVSAEVKTKVLNRA